MPPASPFACHQAAPATCTKMNGICVAHPRQRGKGGSAQTAGDALARGMGLQRGGVGAGFGRRRAVQCAVHAQLQHGSKGAGGSVISQARGCCSPSTRQELAACWHASPCVPCLGCLCAVQERAGVKLGGRLSHPAANSMARHLERSLEVLAFSFLGSKLCHHAQNSCQVGQTPRPSIARMCKFDVLETHLLKKLPLSTVAS